jgi:hypothetical protein
VWIKKEERKLFKNRISAAQKRKKSDPILRRVEGKCGNVRTVIHVRHFPNLPCGEITIEGNSTVKHCTTATKKSPRKKNGFGKKEERALFENRISAEKEAGKKKQPKRDPIVERGESVYVRAYICVTSPTSQVERSRLKALAPSNTARGNKEKSKHKNGFENKERTLFKIESVLPQKEAGKRSNQKKDPMSERGGKSVRTCKHVRHFPDLPGGEITIEGSSIGKHCTQRQRKVQG